MKKAILSIAFAFVMTLGFSSTAHAEGTPVDAETFSNTMGLGLSAPLFGWVSANEEGEVKTVRGINALFGYTQKHYFNPLATGQFNPFFYFGTVILAFPVVGFGGDYLWDNGIFVTLETFYIIPTLTLGFNF